MLKLAPENPLVLVGSVLLDQANRLLPEKNSWTMMRSQTYLKQAYFRKDTI